MIFRNVILLTFFLFIVSCSEKTTYSGLILKDNFKELNFKTKSELTNFFGKPNYIDPIEKNFYYYSEKIIYKNLIKKKIVSRFILVASFDENDDIKSLQKFDLNNQNELKISKDTTQNNLIKKGIIENIFGGIGTQTSLPNTSN